MNDVLERIRAFIALADSPYSEEARSAAAQACRLIREHGVILSLPQAKSEAAESSNDDRDFFQDLINFVAGPSRTYPFDPFTAPFRVVAEYARQKGIEMTDRGQGRYAATIDGKLVVGGWAEVVRAVFSRLESSSARGGGR